MIIQNKFAITPLALLMLVVLRLQMAHIIQSANGQLMLQTMTSATQQATAGQIQVAQAAGTQQHPQLQQIQVLPISGLQVSCK